METRFLETFVLVAELGSLAEASRRLGVTPVAVSQRMQALEEEVGAQLLIRVGRQVKPTQAGYAILDRAREILAEVRSLSSLAQLDRVAGDIRLGAISTGLTGILPPALHALRSTAPDLNAFLLPGTSNDLYRALQGGKIDAALMVEPPFEIHKSLLWTVLRREPLVLLGRADQAADDPLELLRSQPFIRYDRNNWGGRLPDQYLREHRIEPDERYELDSIDAIAVMVRSGLGVALVPDWALPWEDRGTLVRLPLPPPRFERAIGMLRPRSSPVGRLIDVIIDAVRAAGPACHG